MAGEEIFKIEHREIQELKKRIEELEGELEKKKTPELKQEKVKEEIKNYLQEFQKAPSFASPKTTKEEIQELKELEHSQQVGILLSLVFEQGLEKAISLANNLQNPAILDELHDALVDRYYEILLEKGILKF